MHTPRIIALTVVLGMAVSACSSSDSASDSFEGTSATTPSTTAAPDATGTATPTTVPLESVPGNYVGYLHQPTACDADQPDPAVAMQFDGPGNANVSGEVMVTLNTSCGQIELVLDAATAPETVNSFVYLAEQGYFDGTVSHRILPGFMMQAGDPTATGRGGPGYTIPDELPATADYRRGVVAMANAGAGSAGSQFFILFGDAPWLPPSYTIFGEVSQGFEVLNAIEQIPLGQGPASADSQPSTPLNSLYIESITINR
jgi:cyclophilin family peptidyl-prolyl cis-trans isomerase